MVHGINFWLHFSYHIRPFDKVCFMYALNDVIHLNNNFKPAVCKKYQYLIGVFGSCS